MTFKEKIGQMNAEIRATYKSADTEEWFDRVFTKPMGYLWTKLFLKLHWTPNMVTLLNMVIGFTGGWMLLPKSFGWNLAGILLIIWANILDSTDGQLARITGIKSELGRILDGLSTGIWCISSYAALAIRLMSEPIPFTDGHLWGWWIWLPVAVSALAGHQQQCMMADYFRNLHLFFLKNRHGSELSRSRDVKAELAATPRKNLFKRAYLTFYGMYTGMQEAYTPSVQRLLGGIDALEAKGEALPEEARQDFLTRSRRYTELPNILTFNARTYTSFICILLGIPELYFAIEIVLGTALLIFTTCKYESIAEHVFTEYRLPGSDKPKKVHVPWRLIFFLIGAIGAAVMFARSDLDLVDWGGTVLAKMPIWLPALCGLWLVIYLVHALVYRIIIGHESGRIPFLHLLKVTVSGFALNHVTPVGLAGGEPYRIMEMKPYIGGAKATATTLTFSFMYILSHVLLWFTGCLTYLIMGCPGAKASMPFVILIAVGCALVCLPLLTGGRKGFVMPTLKLLTHLPLVGKWVQRRIDKRETSIRNIDREMTEFHAMRGRFWSVVVLEYVGRLLEAAEYFIIFLVLNRAVPYPQCVVALAAASLVGNAIFVVPMQIGARESGLTMALRWFDIPSSFSMTAGLMCRVRELIYLVIGVACMLIRGRQPARKLPEAPQKEETQE